jgi:hypothetical protein
MAAKAKPLTLSEAQRAIYIDFEGTAVDPPSLLGIVWRDGDEVKFVQYVVEEELWPAAEAKSPDHGGECRKATWADLAEIRHRAESERRRVFAWSTHEADVLSEHVPSQADREWFAANVENAILNAKAWKKINHPDVIFRKDPKNPYVGKNQLHKYFGLINYDVPKAFGPGNSAQRIRKVREMLKERGGDYSALTGTKKGQWTKALEHNWHDCDGLREVILQCAADPVLDIRP